MGYASDHAMVVVRWVADHPKTTVKDTEDHCIDGSELGSVQASIDLALAAGLIQSSVNADPAYLMCTAKGFRALGRA